MTPEQLRELAQLIAAREARYTNAFAQQLTAVLRQVERRIWRLVPTPSRTETVTLAELAQVRNGIRRALRDAGYQDLVGQVVDAPLTDLARRIMGHIPVEGSMRVRIQALQVLQAENLLHEGEAVAQHLWQAVMRGVLGARSRARLEEDLAQVIDRSEVQIRTLYDTSLSIYGRQVEALQAGSDPETPFLYVGPDDDVTRPFCRARIGKTFTRAEIDEMDNGQLPDAFLTGGGYNCRHLWLEVAREQAEAA